MSDLVSIIIPCYNQAQFLPETLDSVLAQTYPHWECIIVNDGSPDNTEEIAQKYCKLDERFVYYYKDNSGVSDTRNYGIKKSRGKYILPLDADDKIASTYLENTIGCFNAHPSIKLVYTKVALFGEKNGIWDLPSYDYNLLLKQNHIVCTSLYRREDYNQTNGYNPNMKYGLEDWDFLLSFLQPEDKVICLDEVLFYYRIKNISRNVCIDKKYRETRMQMILNHLDLYEIHITNFLESVNSGIDYKRQYNQIRFSYAYRVACFLLKPFKFLQKCLKKN